MSVGAWVLVVAVVGAGAFGLWRAARDGRFRGTHQIKGLPANPEPELMHEFDEHLGTRATLVQFSSSFCAPCRTTRHVLAAVAAEQDGVVHVEIDAESNLDLVRSLDIMRTPTTLILDARGVEVARASGVPRRDQVLAALG